MANGGGIGQGGSTTQRAQGKIPPRLRRFPFLPPSVGDRLLTQLAELRLRLADAFEREMEAGRGFLWLPVCFGIGVLVYFALPEEPSAIAAIGLVVALAAAAWWNRRRIGAL